MTARERGCLLPVAAVFLSLGILIGRDSLSLWPAAIALALTAIAVIFAGRRRFYALLGLMLALGALLGYSAWHPPLPEAGTYQVSGIVSDELRIGADGKVRTTLTHVTLDDRPWSSGAYWTFYADRCPELPSPGSRITVYASVYHPSPADNPDGYDFREDLLRRNISIGVYSNAEPVISEAPFTFEGVAASWRNRIAVSLTEQLGTEAGGLASAMLLGLRSGFPSEDRTAFSRLGIAHILAVSGFHTGVLIGILAFFFRLFRLSQRKRLWFYGLALALYCSLCGWSMPVIRASILMLLGLWGRILNRPRSGLHLLSAAWILMLIVSPAQLTGISFQLSFGAMFGLVLITPYLRRAVRFRNPFLRRIWALFAAGLAVQIGILIPELTTFHTLPLLGLLVNIPVSFLASLLILLFWVVALLLPFPALCAIPASLVSFLSSAFLKGVRFLGSRDEISLWVGAPSWLMWIGIPLIFIALTVFVRLNSRKRMIILTAGLLFTVLSLIRFPFRGSEYIQFSVGNADAAVIHDQDTVFVVDTGYDDGVLASWLHRRRITPDAVILTHLHSDHVYGIASILDAGIPVPLVYLPVSADKSLIDDNVLQLIERLKAGGTEFRYLSRGDVLSLPSGSLSVLWPENGKVRSGQNANMYSLSAILKMKDTTMLLTGDLDGRYESYSAVQADILKVAHHGSSASTADSFVGTVQPSVMLLSCSTEKKTGTFQDRYPDLPLYSTAIHGALTITFDDHSFSVKPCHIPSVIPGGDSDESE